MNARDLWIPVDEKLPPREWVLVYQVFNQSQSPGQSPMMAMAYYDERDTCWRARFGRLSGIVTHWRALPAPPGEVGL
jgi:hypothetical protein